MRLYFPVTGSSHVPENSEQLLEKTSRVTVLERELDAVIRKAKAAKEMNDLLVRSLQIFNFGDDTDDAKLWHTLKDVLNSLDPMSANYEENKRKVEDDIQKLSTQMAVRQTQRNDQLIKFEQALKECEEKLNKPVATTGGVPGAVEHLDQMEVRRRALVAVIDAIKERGINSRDELEALLEQERDLTEVDSTFLNGLLSLANMLQRTPVPSADIEPSTPPDFGDIPVPGPSIPIGSPTTDTASPITDDDGSGGSEEPPLSSGSFGSFVSAEEDEPLLPSSSSGSFATAEGVCSSKLTDTACKANSKQCTFYDGLCRTHAHGAKLWAANHGSLTYITQQRRAANKAERGNEVRVEQPPNVPEEMLADALAAYYERHPKRKPETDLWDKPRWR